MSYCTIADCEQHLASLYARVAGYMTISNKSPRLVALINSLRFDILVVEREKAAILRAQTQTISLAIAEKLLILEEAEALRAKYARVSSL